MAKTKRRGKRNKKNRNENKIHHIETDNVRACVSDDKQSQNSCVRLDFLSSFTTPSPNLAELGLKKISEQPRVQVVEKSMQTENADTSKNLSKYKINESLQDSFLNYKTPLKRMNSIVQNVSPTAVQPIKKIKSVHSSDKDRSSSSNDSFFTPLFPAKFPLSKVASPVHSTPKTSPVKVEALKIETRILDETVIASSGKKRFAKLRKFGNKWPRRFAQFVTQIETAFKKGFDSIKRKVSKGPTNILQENDQCSDICKNKITSLNTKVDQLTTELYNIKNELQVVNELRNEIKELKEQVSREEISSRELRNEIKELKEQVSRDDISSRASVAGPFIIPPPPPPPPPPSLLNLQTAKSKNLIVAARKVDKEQKNTSRPLITVDAILNVQLRKVSAVPPVPKKPATSNSDELIKQVKLRPLSRSQTPQVLGTSPKSSLIRILKTVDTNVKTVRRLKKSPFLSYDDVSRHPSFQRNESAPVI